MARYDLQKTHDEPNVDCTTQHVYITGGSTGLGLSLAIILTKKGAHVSIVARNQGRIDKALAQLEVSPPSIA